MRRFRQHSARWLPALATVIGLTLPGTMAAEPPTVAGSTFAKDGKTYTARHVIHTSLQTPALLAICFDFKHLKAFYHASEVKLVKSGQDWQTLEYRTDHTIGSSSATYRKTIDRTNHTIRFTLLNHQVTGWGIPVMTASSGSYSISDNQKIRTLVYEQSVTLNRGIGVLDWALIQSKTADFFKGFETYLRQQETLQAARDSAKKEGTPP